MNSGEGVNRVRSVRAVVIHLLSPRSGLLGQVVRFGLSGGAVGLLYLTVTTVLSQAVGVAFQVALVIGFGSGLLLHFTLQRVFVWTHNNEFALPLHHQVGRYLVMAGSQYGLTAASTAVLPRAVGLPTEVVYLITAVLLAIVSFLLLRYVIFHAIAPPVGSTPETSDQSDGA